jgi:hypothetical protein
MWFITIGSIGNSRCQDLEKYSFNIQHKMMNKNDRKLGMKFILLNLRFY